MALLSTMYAAYDYNMSSGALTSNMKLCYHFLS